jgi:hypothetical protein
MRPSTYVAIEVLDSTALICRVEHVTSLWATLTTCVDGQKLYFRNDKFYHLPPTRPERATPIPVLVAWVDIPSYLESHTLSNAILEWAQTKFNSRALGLDESAYEQET